jgi:hypothetical protein
VKETGADNFTFRKRVRNVLFGASLVTAGVFFGMHHTATPDEIVVSTKLVEGQNYGADIEEVVASLIAIGGLAICGDALTRPSHDDNHTNNQRDRDTIHN